MVVRGARCLAGWKVRASFLASDRTYGARRVWHDMLAEGVSCDVIAEQALFDAAFNYFTCA